MEKVTLNRKPRLLVIHSALVPYRLDIFNTMSEICKLELALLTKNNANQHFDQAELVSRLVVEPIYVRRKFRAFGRDVPSNLTRLIDKFVPDIVVTDEFSVATFIVAAKNLVGKRKFNHVIWTDDNKELIKKDGVHRRLARWVLSPLADGWMFISPEIRSYYKRSFGVTKPSAIVPVTHNEITFRKQLKKSCEFCKQAVSEYDLSDKRVLLFVGRLVQIKGLDLLLRAFSKAASQIDDAILVIVGEGEERVGLEALALELGIQSKVRFVGRYEGVELAAWYRIGHVLSLASRFEAFGAVVNEALIAGIPVVISSNAGAKSLIEEGVNGSVIVPDMTNDFAVELVRWLERAEPLVIEETIKPNLMSTRFADVEISVAKLFVTLQENRSKG